MSKISGWTKLAPSAATEFEPTWKNNRTGKILIVAHVQGGGGVVYVQTGDKELQNALGGGYGFRTHELAMRWAANYRKTFK